MFVKTGWTKRLVLLLIVYLGFLSPCYESSAKCNRKLLNEFGLTGIDYSISDRMQVCKYVHEKCCSVSDEIKLLKYWQANTKPLLDRYYGLYMSTLGELIKSFKELMTIDPRLMVLKHVEIKTIPYSYRLCSSKQSRETREQKDRFEIYMDEKMKSQIAPDFYRGGANKGKEINIDKFVRDWDGSRHWTYKMPIHLKVLTKAIKAVSFGGDNKDVPENEYGNLKCRKYTHRFSKEFIIVNEVKSEFCLDVYDKFLMLDIREVEIYMSKIGGQLREIHNMKSSLYCAMCNIHEQKYFDAKSRQLIMSEDFCKDFMTEYHDFIRFANVVFIEFMDEMLQYIQCFETDARIFNFPFTNFLVKYKRRIPFIKDCLANLNKPEMRNKCWFICNKYNIMRYNPFFDGDVKLVRRIYITILSFRRKVKLELKKGKKLKKSSSLLAYQNVNGLTIEPLSPSHALSKRFYMDKKTRKWLLGKSDTRHVVPHKSAALLLHKFLREMGQGKLRTIKSLTIKGKKYKPRKRKKKKKGKKSKKGKKGKKRKKSKKSKKRKRKKKRKKRRRKRKKYVKAGAIGLNGARNYLHTLKNKNELHHGFFPQRKLAEIKNKHLKRNKKPKKKSVGVPIEFVKHPTTETAAHFYESNLPAIGYANFTIGIDKDGIDPFKNRHLVDFKYNITNLIGTKFKEDEELTEDVIVTYLRNNAKFRNNFNFDFDTLIEDYDTVSPNAPSFKKARKIANYAKRKGKTLLLTMAQQSMRKYVQRIRRARNRKKMLAAFLKQRKKDAMNRKINKHHKVVKTYDHEIAWKEKGNFDGIIGLFTGIFGK